MKTSYSTQIRVFAAWILALIMCMVSVVFGAATAQAVANLPTDFTYTTNDTGVTITNGDAVGDVTISNVVDETSSDLPFTGGQGIAMAVILAALLAIGAFLSMVIGRRRA